MVHAYGIDSSPTGRNVELGSSPKSFTCAPAPLPPNMARRWVTSPTSFTDWKLSSLDVGRYADLELAKLPKIDDLPTRVSLAQSDDGSPAIWVIDGAAKRHVVDPASMAAWRFDSAAVTKTPAAKLATMATAPDWPAAPILVEGSGPEVYVLDVAPAAGTPGTDGGTSGPPGAGTGTPPGTPGDDGGASDGATASTNGGGCSAGASGRVNGSWGFVMLGLYALARRRRASQAARASRT